MFIKTWGEIQERLDPPFYLNMTMLDKEIVQCAKYPLFTFKQKLNMQRGRFGHRPRNDPRYYGGKYPFIQTGNIVKASASNGEICYSQTLNELGLSTSKLFNDKVLVITIAANIGYTAILDYTACFPDSLVALTIKGDDLSLEYLNIYIRLIRKYIENLAPQAAQKNINLKQLAKLPLIVPKHSIQEEICEIMERAYMIKNQKKNEAQALRGEIDHYLLQKLEITMSESEKDTLENRMFFVSSDLIINSRFDQEYYSDRYMKFLRAIEASRYKKYTLADISSKIFNGSTPATYEYSEEETEYPIIKVSSYKKDFIDLKEVSYTNVAPAKQVRQNDIFILSAAHQNGYVGKFIKFLKDIPKQNTGFVGEFICIRANEQIEPLLLFYILNLDIYKELLNREKRGQTAHIYPKDISKIPIVLPDKDLQNEWVKHIKDIIDKADFLEKEADEEEKKAVKKVREILLGEETR